TTTAASRTRTIRTSSKVSPCIGAVKRRKPAFRSPGRARRVALPPSDRSTPSFFSARRPPDHDEALNHRSKLFEFHWARDGLPPLYENYRSGRCCKTSGSLVGAVILSCLLT